MLENNLLIKLLKEKIRYTTERHAIISSNIANISTPMAKTKDLPSFASVLSGNIASKLPLSVTKSSHIIKQDNFNSYPIILSKDGTEEKLNGNNISLSNESTKLNMNNLEYQKTMAIYSKILSLFHIITGHR